jgi:Tol biopolymer transport system component
LALMLAAAQLFAGVTIGQIMAYHGAASPEISPDGSRVVYVSAGEIRQITIASGVATSLVKGSSPRWSPDGSSIAYMHDRQIWLTRPAKQLTRENGEDQPQRELAGSLGL